MINQKSGDHSKIEVVAWLCTILGLPLGCASFYIAYQSQHSSVVPHVIEDTSTITVRSKEKQQTPSSVKITELASSKRNLRIAFDSAKGMSNYSSRDSALSHIVHNSLRFSDYDFALQVVDEINNYNSKDSSLMEIVDASLRSGDTKHADKAASEMNNNDNLDEAKRRIVDYASK